MKTSQEITQIINKNPRIRQWRIVTCVVLGLAIIWPLLLLLLVTKSKLELLSEFILFLTLAFPLFSLVVVAKSFSLEREEWEKQWYKELTEK